MNNKLKIIIFDKDIVVIEDVFASDPKKVYLDKMKFESSLKQEVQKIFPNMFSDIVFEYDPCIIEDVYDKDEFIIDTLYPYQGGFSDTFLFKKLRKSNHSEYSRVLGFLPGVIWTKLNEDYAPIFKQKTIHKFLLLSIQWLYNKNKDKYIKNISSEIINMLKQSFEK